VRPLKPLDPTWWVRNHEGDYTQQGNRGMLRRMEDASGRTVAWAILADGKCIGERKNLRDAKREARKLTGTREP
jgi:hypothetical protein